MTNFEKYKEEIQRAYDNNVPNPQKNNIDRFYEACESVCKKYTTYQVYYADLVWKWLLEEYIEPIYLKKIERSIILFCLVGRYKNTKFKDIELLDHLKNNGHFKNVYNIDMTICQIANNMKPLKSKKEIE